MEEGPSRVTLRLEGRIGGPWVRELERLCADLLSEGSCITLDLADVAFLDEGGVGLIQHLLGRGVKVSSSSPFVATQLQEVLDWTNRGDPERDRAS